MKFIKLDNMKIVDPEPCACITVDSPDHLFQLNDRNVLTHNSVTQRTIFIECLLRSKDWVFLGIDLKRVELGKLRRFGCAVGTTLEDATMILRFMGAVMMSRYEAMEKQGVNDFKDLEGGRPQAILLNIDELSTLTSPETGKSDEAKAAQLLKDECVSLIASIARLGRASGTHLLLGLQRADVKYIGGGETRSNLTTSIGCGAMKPMASTMCFGSNAGCRTPGNPKGRLCMTVHGSPPLYAQGFFASGDWLEDYYKEHGIPLPGEAGALTDMGDVKMEKIENTSESISNDEALADWDDDMKAIYDAKE